MENDPGEGTTEASDSAGSPITDDGNPVMLTQENPSPRSSAQTKHSRGDLLTSFAARFAFFGAWLMMIVLFWLLEPRYMSWTSAKSILSGEQALIFLALALMATLVIGEIDLSVTSTLGLAATLVLVLNIWHDVDLLTASIIAVAVSTLVGVVNGILVVGFGVSPFVVTLGMGTFVLGIGMAISDMMSIAGLDRSFTVISTDRIGPFPISFYYGVIGALVFAYVLYRTPLGHQMRFVGANPVVARLAGIRVRRIKFCTFVFAAFISGVGGVVMVAGLGGYNASGSGVFLLPVISATFLSTAVFDPGKFNPLGVLVSVYFLRSGVVGLQMLGVAEWCKSAFYGGALVVAVTASTLLDRRRADA